MTSAPPSQAEAFGFLSEQGVSRGRPGIFLADDQDAITHGGNINRHAVLMLALLTPDLSYGASFCCQHVLSLCSAITLKQGQWIAAFLHPPEELQNLLGENRIELVPVTVCSCQVNTLGRSK